MSGAPVKKLPASPSVSSPSVPVADRGGEEVNIGFSDFGAGSGNQLRDPRARRRAGNHGNEFHMSQLLYEVGKGTKRSRTSELINRVQRSGEAEPTFLQSHGDRVGITSDGL